MSLGKTLDGFRFHIFCKGDVYSVVCPKEGVLEYFRRDGTSFLFTFAHEESINFINVFVHVFLYASKSNTEDFPLAVVRAAKHGIEKGNHDVKLSEEDYLDFAVDKLAGASDPEIRTAVMDYILRRYEAQFEPPFSVLEVVLALESHIAKVLRAVHYMHKHEQITFPWPRGDWREQPDEIWLTENFQITDSNLSRLKAEIVAPALSDSMGVQFASRLQYDVFICHASEDKSAVAEPLAKELSLRGKRVWYDAWTIKVGDSIRRMIDKGLVDSHYGVVIMSPHFFKKEWPQKELDGLVQKEVAGRKVVLPVWHNIDEEYIRQRSPTLADKRAVNTSHGIAHVADEVIKAIGPAGAADSPASRRS